MLCSFVEDAVEKRAYKIPYAVKINPVLRERVQQYCASRGLKQGHFVERALQEQLAREALLEDRNAPFTEEEYRKLDQLRKTSPRKTYTSYQAFLKDLKKDLQRH